MATLVRQTVTTVSPPVHIGAYYSHTTAFIQLRRRAHSSSHRENDDLDVRWVSLAWPWYIYVCGMVFLFTP